MKERNDKPEPSPLSAVLTIDEASALLRISRGSAYEAARCGEIPTIRLGRRLLVPRAKLMAMLGIEVEASLSVEPGVEAMRDADIGGGRRE